MTTHATQQNNVPKLRFSGFHGPWRTVRLGDHTSKVGSGVTPKGGAESYVEQGVPLLRSQNVKDSYLDLSDVVFIDDDTHESMAGSAVLPLDVLLNITGASIGRSCVVPKSVSGANVNQHVCIIRPTEVIRPHFLQTWLASSRGQKQIFQAQAGGGREGLNFENIRRFNISIPTVEEQEKVSLILSAVDHKIAQLERKKMLLEAYKKGCLDKLFSGEIRFKDDSGDDFPDWETRKLEDLAQRKTEKNSSMKHARVLTNSAAQGVIDQGDFFDHDVANSDNLDGYYVVDEGDFVYNPRISNLAPVGPIKRNNLGIGVMSPLYSVFRFAEKETDFWAHYYSSSVWHRYMKKVANYGARHDRMAISIGDFMAMPLPYPSFEERLKITTFLNVLDSRLASARDAHTHAVEFKKGLLQQMFV